MAIPTLPFRAAVVAAAASLLASCDKPAPPAAPPPEIPVVTVEKKDVPIVGEFVGEMRGSTDIDVRARVEGFLVGMDFKEGTWVKKGDPLYTIDQRPFEQRRFEADARLAQAKTRLANADAELKRIKPLAEMNAVSQRDLDSAVARYGTAEAEVKAEEAGVELAKIDLSYTKIESPTDGLIGLSLAKVGDFVGRYPNPVVLNTVSQLDPIAVRFSVSEPDYLKLARKNPPRPKGEADPRAGQLELLLSDGTIHDHRGSVTVVNREIDSATGSLLVEAEFPNPDKLLRPGQFARVRTVLETLSGAVVVPRRSIQELQGLYQVYVIGPGDKIELKTVKIGPAIGDMQVVTEGVKAGDRIVFEGLQRVRADMVVRPVEPGAKASETDTAKVPAEPAAK